MSQTINEKIEKKATTLCNQVTTILAEYDAENTPDEERYVFMRTDDAENFAAIAESTILATEVTDLEGCKKIRKAAIELDKNQKKTSIRDIVRSWLSGKSDEVVEKTVGGNIKAVNDLLAKDCDWCKRTYETLKIGQISKKCLAFELYRWKEETGRRIANITGQLSIQQIEKMSLAESEKTGKEVSSTEWANKHKVQVCVDVKSPTLLKSMYNEMTCVGIVYVKYTASLDKVLECIQREFAYKAFFEAQDNKKVNVKAADGITTPVIKPKTGKAHKAIVAAAAC